MKKNLPLFFLFLVLNHLESKPVMRTCKTDILRSFLLHSRLTPNKFNALCPSVKLNCCTTEDIMTIHKTWTTQTKKSLSMIHIQSFQSFKKLKAIIMMRDQMKLKDIEYAFKKIVKPKARLTNHTSDILVKLSSLKQSILEATYKKSLSKIKLFHVEVKSLRRSLLCSFCEWHNHNYIDLDSMTVTYSTRFCTTMALKFSKVLYDKYGTIFKFLLLLDEFIYLITGRHLMENAADRITYSRYILLIEKCKGSPDTPSMCIEFCRNFNLNKLSYLFDGEKEVIRDYLARFFSISELLTGSKENYYKLFATQKESWSTARVNKFAKHTSILSGVLHPDPHGNTLKSNAFNLQFKPHNIKRIIEKPHPLSPLQMELLDDQLSSLVLYRVAADPIDITEFVITFSEEGGYNLFRDREGINMDVTADQLMALIHHKLGKLGNLSEAIEDSVERLLSGLNISNIGDFLSTVRLSFKKMTPEEQPGVKNDSQLAMRTTGKNSYIWRIGIVLVSLGLVW